jgi:hypothetical protein
MSNYFELQNAPVLTTPSALTAPKITSIGYPGDDTAADPAGGQAITLTGEGFEAGASVIINNAAVGVVSVVSSTTITFTSPALSTGSYPVYVVNTDGGTAIAVPGIQYSGTPTWTTAAGSLGSYTETQAISNTVTATGDAPISYSLFSGTLPTGASLNSANGLISGTSPLSASPTTYTFTIRATDAQQQDTNRSFSLTINPDVVTWSSPANGTTYTSVVNSAISNVALSATAASGQSVSYTANALPTGLSISGSNITGTPTVVANSSTLLTATAATTNATATRTINWVISVASDPSFAYVTTLLSANNPASTFVTDASTNNFAVSVFGDTRPNNFGPYTPGYYSNFFDGNGDYLSLASNTAFAFGTGDFTVEAWIMRTGGSGNQPICQSDAIGTSQNDKWWFAVAGGGLFFGTHNAGGFNVVTTTTFDTNVWYHVAVSRSSGTMYMFVNGVSTAFTTSGTPSGYNLGQNGFTVGGMSTPSYWTGYISNLRVTKGTALYTSSFTVSSTPLTAVASTSLLTCQSNRFIDTSTNNFTITRFGDTLVSGFDPFAPLSTYSTYGSGYFDGTGDYLSVPDNAALDMGSSNFTIEGWYFPLGNASGNTAIFSKRADGSEVNGVLLYYGSTGLTPQLLVDIGGSWAVVITSSSAFVSNSWNHFAVVRNGSTFTLYINGISGGTATNAGTIRDNDRAFAIGAMGANGAGTISACYMSEFRVVKGTAVYTSNFTPPTAPLTAITNTSLLTLQNNQPNNNNMFLDSSTNNFLITRNGNTTQGSFSPYGGGWSNYTGGAAGGASRVDVAGTSGIFGTNISYTIEGWFNFTANSAGDNTNIITYNTNTFPSRWLIDAAVGGGNITLRIVTESNGTLFNGTAVPYTLRTWVHLAIVNNNAANTFTFYINGVAAGSTTKISLSAVATLNLLCNSGSVSSASPFYVSNFRIVNNTAVYTSNFTPSTSPLTAIPGTALLTFQSNRFVDNSAGNLTLTPNGTNQIQRFNPFNPVLTTPTSYSGYFDGNGDFLSVATNSAFNMGSGDYTFEAWVYLPTLASINRIFSSSDSGFGSGYFISVNTSGFVTVETNSPSYQQLASTNNAVTANTWTHVAVTKQSGTVRVFVNGVQCTTTGSQTNSFDTGGNALQVAGSIYAAAFGYLTGYVSNARIVKGTAVYTSAFTPSTTPLTAVSGTSLLTLQNATFIDNSTNNFTLTANGNSQPTQFNPFGWTSTTGTSAAYSATNYGGSMYFDGSGDFLSVAAGTGGNLSSGNFTVELWFYPTVSGVTASLIQQGEYDWRLNTGTSNQLGWITAGGPSLGGGSLTSPDTFIVNAWNHVAISKSGSTQTMYLNGRSQGTITTSPFNTTNAVAIGMNTASVGSVWPFTGYISNVRIVKGQAVYTSNFALPVAPLSFNANATLQVNGTSAAIYDSSMIVTYETLGNSNSTTVIKKYGNSSMYFDGTGDYLLTPSSPTLNFGSSDFTVEGWVYPTSLSSDWFIISAVGSGGFFVGFSSVQTVGFGWGRAAVAWDYRVASTATINTWQHVAVTRSGTSMRLFVNGVQQGTTQTISTAYNLGTSGTSIGSQGANYYLTGYLDDLRVTNGVARYTSNFTPPTTPFIGN